MPDTKLAHQSGFTLIEISIVMAIIGVMLYGSMSLLVTSVQTAQVNSTVATIDAIEKALLNYRVAFGRIPCPSDLTATASSTNYGVEAANQGNCTGGSPAANTLAASGTVEGGIPTRALRLPDSYMYDGWKHKLRYAVNPNYTVTTNTPCSLGTNPAITVNDASGSPRSTAAIYAIISHGANGHGAYTSNGVVVNSGSTNADELTNCHCTSSGAAGTYTPTYIQKYPTIATAGSPNTTFDDIVSYKEFWELMTPNMTSNTLGCLFTGYTRTITLDHTKVGTVSNTDQTNFPVLFSGTYPYLATVGNGGGAGTVTNANGYDITFTSDAAGNNLLPFERESYNAASGAVTFWVQVPTLSHSADSVIYLWYGNPNSTTDQSNKTGTWDSNFGAVYHLKETPTGAVPADSTSNANTLSYGGTWASSHQVAGQIDGSLSFDGSTDYLQASSSATVMPTGNITVSMWIKFNNYTTMTGNSIYKNWSAKGNGSYSFYGDSSHYLHWQWMNTSGTTSDAGAKASALSTGTWYHIVATRSTTPAVAIYINGVSQTLTNSGSFSGTMGGDDGSFWIGGSGPYNAWVNSIIDEVRVSSTVRSADWINTEYNNQSAPDKATYGSNGFYTIGSQTSSR